MKTEKLNSWLSLGANIGVVLGLILLIIEIGQNTEMMRAQINQSRTEAAMSEQQATYNSDYMPALFLKRDNGERLSGEEVLRYEAFLRSLSRNMDNQLWQYQQGLLGENIPRSIRGAVRGVIGNDKLAIEIWDKQKYGFTDEYVAFVEETIAEMRDVSTSVNDQNPGSSFLFVWAADEDKQDTDFLAVLDANPGSESYGEVLRSVAVGVAAGAHHTEHRMPEDGRLFVNGFRSGHSFVVDLNDPLDPSVLAHFTTIDGYSHPHSFERLPNGNVLATFQNGPDGERITGGIAELGPTGEPLRRASAAVAEFPEIRPYSLTVLPENDLVVTTTTDMWGEENADLVQFWQLSDLSLKRTQKIPAGPRGDEQFWPAEPRLMADGTLIINTFKCGLYQVHDFASDEPRIEHVYTFENKDDEGEEYNCALPALAGPYWIQTVPARNGLVAIDLSDPKNPREVSSVYFGTGWEPHWIAIEPNDDRIVVTGYGEMRNSVAMVTLDTSNGSLSLDRAFGDNGVANFARTNWPHGAHGAAIPHGSVFSNP